MTRAKIPRVRLDPQVIAVCIQRAGLLRGPMIAEFIAEWAICAEDLGHEPTTTEFAAWWKDSSERTAWRRISRFREAFPEVGEDGTPGDLARAEYRELVAARPTPAR